MTYNKNQTNTGGIIRRLSLAIGVLFVVSALNAEKVEVDFNSNMETQNIQPIQSDFVNLKNRDNVQKNKENVVYLSELLLPMSFEDKVEFVNSIVIKNGHIVSFNCGILYKYFSDEEINTIIKKLFFKKEKSEKSMTKRYCSIHDILKNLPVEKKVNFVESFIVKNGLIVSASVKMLDSLSNEEKFELLNSIFPNTNQVNSSNIRVLCGEGWCAEYMCIWSSLDGIWKCRSREDSVCDTSCGN